MPIRREGRSVSTEQGTTARGERFVSLTCDGCGLTMHAVGAGIVRLEAVLVPSNGRHICPACRVRHSPGLVQIPHPEHG